MPFYQFSMADELSSSSRGSTNEVGQKLTEIGQYVKYGGVSVKVCGMNDIVKNLSDSLCFRSCRSSHPLTMSPDSLEGVVEKLTICLFPAVDQDELSLLPKNSIMTLLCKIFK